MHEMILKTAKDYTVKPNHATYKLSLLWYIQKWIVKNLFSVKKNPYNAHKSVISRLNVYRVTFKSKFTTLKFLTLGALSVRWSLLNRKWSKFSDFIGFLITFRRLFIIFSLDINLNVSLLINPMYRNQEFGYQWSCCPGKEAESLAFGRIKPYFKLFVLAQVSTLE